MSTCSAPHSIEWLSALIGQKEGRQEAGTIEGKKYLYLFPSLDIAAAGVSESSLLIKW